MIRTESRGDAPARRRAPSRLGLLLGISLTLLAPGAASAQIGGGLPVSGPVLTPAQQERLQALLAQKHPWAMCVKLLADWHNPYADLGQWDTLAWVMTGDATYARTAIQAALAGFSEMPGNANETRENFIHWALHYAWLRDQMTLDERLEYRRRLRIWSAVVLDLHTTPTFGTRLDDSDVVVGHHLGLAVTRLVTADEPLIEDLLAATPGPKGSTFEAQRATIAAFCERAQGGEWIESSSYNSGTLSLLFLGVGAVGLEGYPEVAELGRQVAEWLPWTFTPDLKDSAEWGDDSWAHNPELWSRVSLLGQLCGLGLDTTGSARVMVDQLTRDVFPYPSYWYDLYRPLYVFDPTSPLPDVPPAPPRGFRAATGVGLALHRGDDHLLQVNAPNPVGVDHQVYTNAEVRLWLGGEWVLDCPRGYAQQSDTVNAAILSGLGPMRDRKLLSATGDDRSARVSWRTGGSYVGPVYYDPPPNFLNAYTRTVDFELPAQLVVTDTFDGADPLQLPKFDRYYGDVRHSVQNRPALWTVVWNCPTQPVATPDGYRWQTPGGRTVHLTFSSPSGPVTATVIKLANASPAGYFYASELTGWQVRILSNTPRATVTSKITVDAD